MKLSKLTSPNTQQAIKKLLDQPLAAKTAFKLKGVAKRVTEELTKYEEVRKDAIQKYGSKVEGTEDLDVEENGNVRFTNENMLKFVAEITDLTNTEVEIPTIKIDDLGDVELSATDLMSLDGLVTE
jgi:translation initiation factor 2 alpha subunit (eIF-2alpha)